MAKYILSLLFLNNSIKCKLRHPHINYIVYMKNDNKNISKIYMENVFLKPRYSFFVKMNLIYKT
jgi:hypothetical protein